MKPTLQELEKLLWGELEVKGMSIVAEPYIITPHDNHCNDGVYECPPVTVLHFSPDDFFSIFDESLEKDGKVVKDELKRVTVETPAYKLHLVGEHYSNLREFQDRNRMYRLNTECLIPSLGRIYLPRCSYFALFCTRYTGRQQSSATQTTLRIKK